MNPKRDLIKTMAAIAATATALAGMLAISQTANAAGEPAESSQPVCTATIGDAKITINAKDANQLKKSGEETRDYKVIRLANYTVDREGHYTGLQAAWDVKNPVIGKDGKYSAPTAQDIAMAGVDTQDVEDAAGTKYVRTNNRATETPMQWVAQHLLSDNDGSDSGVRKFVDAIDRTQFSGLEHNLTLAEGQKAEPSDYYIKSYLSRPDALIHDPAQQPTSQLTVGDDGSGVLTLTFQDNMYAGMYLIYDLSGDQTFGSKTYSASKTMLVGTPLTSAGASCTPIANASGTINVKSQWTQKGEFQFTKVKEDGATGLQGAVFVIKQDGKYGVLTDGKWEFTADTADTATEIKSATNGIVKFPGLPADEYTVEEKTVPDGYLQEAKPSFDVTISFDENGNLTYSATGAGAYAGLVLGDQKQGPITSGLKVRNVTSKNQLPQTGAEGIALFVMVAVLLAGAAGVTFVRSRMVKRALR